MNSYFYRMISRNGAGKGKKGSELWKKLLTREAWCPSLVNPFVSHAELDLSMAAQGHFLAGVISAHTGYTKTKKGDLSCGSNLHKMSQTE